MIPHLTTNLARRGFASQFEMGCGAYQLGMAERDYSATPCTIYTSPLPYSTHNCSYILPQFSLNSPPSPSKSAIVQPGLMLLTPIGGVGYVESRKEKKTKLNKTLANVPQPCERMFEVLFPYGSSGRACMVGN